MNTRGISLILFLSISALAVDKGKFRVNPATSYPNKQTTSGLTIAAVAYTTDEQAKAPFGKTNPYEHGVLPVLIVMQNDAGKALRLDALEVSYVTESRRTVEATPSADVPYLEGAKRPNFGGNPLPIPRRKPKSKLLIPEIDGLAFHAKMLPAGESAHGFLYFQTAHQKGAHLYVRGMVEAASGKELLYVEIPLE